MPWHLKASWSTFHSCHTSLISLSLRRRLSEEMNMEQVAWTLIALLAGTLFGTLIYLGNKIDAMNSSINARIDALGARLDSRIDALSSQLQAHVERHIG